MMASLFSVAMDNIFIDLRRKLGRVPLGWSLFYTISVDVLTFIIDLLPCLWD